MKRLFAVTLLTIAVTLLPIAMAACASADPYPLLPGGSSWAPTTIGTPVRGVALYVQPRPGDQVELVSAEPIGTLSGAEVRFYFSKPVISADGTRTIGEDLQPLGGASVSVDPNASAGPENAVGVVAEITPRTAGTFSLTGVRLHFRLNGGREQAKEETGPFLTVCADNLAPVDCAPPPD